MKSSDTNVEDDGEDGCPKTRPVEVGAEFVNPRPVVATVVAAGTVAATVATAVISVVGEDSPPNDCSKHSLLAGPVDESSELRVDAAVGVAGSSGAGTAKDVDAAVPVAIDGAGRTVEVASVAVAAVVAVVVVVVVVARGLKSIPDAVEDEGGIVKRPAAGEDDTEDDEA